ncbi:MAG: pobA 2 [Chloroflexi bacterium]|nr:pobA 2 [Chloroflexota bacterium]
MAAVGTVRPSVERQGAPWRDFVHTGPDTLAGRYLRTFWHPVYLAKDLAPGRAKPIHIMGEDFTLYRGETGAPHIVAFRCAHRGTQLSTGWVEGDEIRCFYHGWKYDAGGQCVEQPAEPEPFCGRIKIRGYPTEQYLGLIFAYLGDSPAPPLTRYPEFESDDEVFEETLSDLWPCNYFQRIENIPDLSHVPFTHFQLGRSVPRVEVRETEYGVDATGYHLNGRIDHVHYQMPNVTRFVVGARDSAETSDRDRIKWKVPVDDEHCLDFAVSWVHVSGDGVAKYRERQAERAAQESAFRPIEELGEEVLSSKARVQDMLDHPNATNIQDYMTMIGQGSIVDRGIEHLGRPDVGVTLIRRIWERELRAFAEGRHLKNWTESQVVPPVEGE